MPLRKSYGYETLDKIVDDLPRYLGNKTIASRHGDGFSINYDGEVLFIVCRDHVKAHIFNELENGRERLDRYNRFLPGEWVVFYYKGKATLYHPDNNHRLDWGIGSGAFLKINKDEATAITKKEFFG